MSNNNQLSEDMTMARALDWWGFRTASGRKGYYIYQPTDEGQFGWPGPIHATAIENHVGRMILRDNEDNLIEAYRGDVQPQILVEKILDNLTR